MIYTGYELLWLFVCYSFLGWCMESVYTAVEKRKFINKGFLNGIICPVYGFASVFMLVFLDTLKNNWFYLFLGCMIIGSVIELVTGLILEKIFELRLWDYSELKFNVGGYICLRHSLVWGILGMFILKIINPLFMMVFGKLPYVLGIVFLIVIGLLFLLDTVTTIMALLKIKYQSQAVIEITEGFVQASHSLRTIILNYVKQRMDKASASQKKRTEEQQLEAQMRKKVFAFGCSFHKSIWIFFWGALLGDFTETMFCWITTGKIMSRSSVVYGSFSLVWGIGVAVFTVLLYRYRQKEDRYIFIAGMLLGGVYEYICSVFTEIAFGTVFWDYSKIPFNLGGRINLLYCFFWGFAAVIWMKLCYPWMSKWIEKIPMKPGKILTGLFVAFMVFNITMSGMALTRHSERNQDIEAKNPLEHWVDGQFPDERMKEIYPNAKMTP